MVELPEVQMRVLDLGHGHCFDPPIDVVAELDRTRAVG